MPMPRPFNGLLSPSGAKKTTAPDARQALTSPQGDSMAATTFAIAAV
jgi:hypothetical protein